MKKIRQGNDTFFSVLVFNKKAILSEEATHEEDSAVDLSQVKNLKVQGVRLHPESFFFLPSKVEGNLIKVEFPSERQELGAYDVQIDYDTDNETSEDGLLHHRLRLALCRVIETNDYCNEDSADIDAPIKAYVLDAFKGVQGEKGERGEQGLQGIQGERGERGEQGLQGIQGEKGERGEQGLQGIQGEKGDKGDKLTFADLTEQDKRELKGEQGLQGERGQDGINGTNGENGRDGRDGEKGKSALELLNEENSTEHSSITEALKALMPKSDGDSKGLEFLFHEWAENISISRMMLKGELRFILDNFDHFRDIVLKYKKDNNIGYYNVAEILKEVTPLSIAESFYKKGWGSLYIYPNFINHSRFHKGDCYFEYAILGRDDVHPSYLPASVSLPDEESKVRILVIDRVTKTGGLFEVDFTNIRSEIDKEDDHHILLYTDDEFTNHSIDEFDKFMISESGENFSVALSDLGIQDIENFRPLFYKSFAIKSVADVDFDYLNNSIFENQLPTDDSAI